ncbi:hypothetical protein [Polaromonas sp. CG9_12]|nr:hypothetical protein [Polaromonas sp. CG9_12]
MSKQDNLQCFISKKINVDIQKSAAACDGRAGHLRHRSPEPAGTRQENFTHIRRESPREKGLF